MLNILCERNVTLGDFVSGLMGIEADGNPVIEIVDLGVMVAPFTFKRQSHKERHRLGKVLELEVLDDAVVLELPTLKPGQLVNNLGF